MQVADTGIQFFLYNCLVAIDSSESQTGMAWDNARSLMFVKHICKQSLLDPSVTQWDDTLVFEAKLAITFNTIQEI
ncbi:hypothetical protein [Wolbachia endosymbiont (group A) of Ennomos erosarius]|uniref:hypothetical protein n=1 Tax=Wolbachia endosymbiont (group A) of Ennomos erosarius TaxID=3066174 RepID=UPI00334029FB